MATLHYIYYRVHKISFFLENALKKTTEYFQKFLFLFKSSILENNFIEMAASASYAVAYTIGSIFKHIIDYVQPYFWLHKYYHLKRQLSLACRHNTYLWRHPTNNSPTVSNRSSELAKRHQLCG